jgi:hypothetical protein
MHVRAGQLPDTTHPHIGMCVRRQFDATSPLPDKTSHSQAKACAFLIKPSLDGSYGSLYKLSS